MTNEQPGFREPSFLALALRRPSFLFGAILLLVALPFLLIGIGLTIAGSAFDRSAVTVQGTVVGKILEPATSDSSTEYLLRYRFATDRGQEVVGVDEVDFDEWDRLSEGDSVEVRYSPSNPASNRVGSERDSGLVGPIFSAVGGGLAILAIVLLARAIRGVREVQRLWRDGQPAIGLVTGIEMTNVRVNDRPTWKLVYEYSGPSGERHRGESHHLSGSEAETWQPGDAVTVHYDPARPDRSVPIRRA